MVKNKTSFFTILLMIIAGLLSIIVIYLKNILLELQLSKNPPTPNVENLQVNKEDIGDSMILKLSAKRAIVQLNTLLPQIHLTLISVLQGLALAILIGHLMTQIESDFSISIESFLLYVNSLLIIVLIWYLYTSVFVTFMWPFSFLTTLLQFCLTITQSISFLFITRPGAWTIGVAITALIGGVIRFVNTKIARPEMYEKREVFNLDTKTEREASVIFFILGIIFTIAGLFQLRYLSPILDIMVATVILITILFLIFSSYKTQTTLMNTYFENSPWTYEDGLAFEEDTTTSSPEAV